MKGLTSEQASQYLIQFGFNVIDEQKSKPSLIKLLEQFKDFLTLLLIVAAIFSFVIGEFVDGTLIFIIIILNAFFGLYQEAKAEESLKVLKKFTITKIRVIRDKKEMEIDSKFLVPGDLAYLEEGVKVPADGLIEKSINLVVNEAALTGESFPIVKIEQEEIFSGTIIAKGRGYMKVLKTGNLTKLGQIAKNISLIKDDSTPLQKKLIGLTRFIGISGIILAITVFFVSLLEGTGYFPAFLLSVSLAVAIVPEGLPAVMTITLAIGMKKMAGKKAVVKRLSAIETLGSVTLIATDKTGTLTANKMQVKEVFVDKSVKILSQLNSSSKVGPRHLTSIDYLLLNGILCSTASLVYKHDHGEKDILGDPTEGALLLLADKEGIDVDEIRKEWQLLDEQPFDSVTKMMSVSVQNKSKIKELGSKIIFSKGAPESILNVCEKIMIGDKEVALLEKEKDKIRDQVDRWAKQGLRVLAFLFKNSQKDGIFLGMVAIHDEPRPEIKNALLKAKNAGIKVVMITGDNEKTAEAIGLSCGLMLPGDEILTGVQLDKYDDRELLAILPKVKIFARTNPFQKHRIVSLYQKLGEIVAVTGDGVNDAIALKQADVGIAMGLVGTDVARETADMVITDDNFATIITAIEEGRNITNSIKNAVKYLLACNVSEAAAIVFSLILGLPTLFFPIQLLYINLVTDGLPALMLSFSPQNSELMSITPQKEMVLLAKKDQLYIGLVGMIGSLLVIASYYIFFGQKLGGTAVFSVLTLIQSFIFIDLWLSHKHIHKNLEHISKPLFLIGFLVPVFLQFFILSSHFSASLFKVSTVSIPIYFAFIGLSMLVLTGIWGVKKLVKL